MRGSSVQIDKEKMWVCTSFVLPLAHSKGATYGTDLLLVCAFVGT